MERTRIETSDRTSLQTELRPEFTRAEQFTRADSISVTIPTRNSAASLPRCLASVAEQGVSAEVIVADDCSTDGTLQIAESFGAKILTGPLPLLEARYQAFRSSRGDAVLLLDSDQFLQHHALSRCLSMLARYDALVLEETSLEPTTWISRLFAADRRAVHRSASLHLHPDSGSLLPRLFRRPILAQAFDLIAPHVRHVAVAQDHAIIAQCVGQLTHSIGIAPKAVQHEEMTTLREMYSKYFRWGVGLADLFRLEPRYRDLTRSGLATRFHRGEASWRDYQRSLTLMGLKSIPYALGYLYGRVANSHSHCRDCTD